MIALNTFETSDNILYPHTNKKTGQSLQIAITSSIELHVMYNTIFYFYIDVCGAGSLSFIWNFH